MKKTKANFKKVLSTFLAVLMLVTSCSVAFGVNAFDSTSTDMNALQNLEDLFLDNFDLIYALYSEDSTVATVDDFVGNAYTSSYTAKSGDTTNLNKEIYFVNYADFYAFNELLEAVWYAADYVMRYNASDVARSNTVSNGSYAIKYTDDNTYAENVTSLGDGIVSRLTGSDYNLSAYSSYLQYFVDLVFGWRTGDDIDSTLDKKGYDDTDWGNTLNSYSSDPYSYLQINVTAYTNDAIGWFDFNDSTDYNDMHLKNTYTVTMHRTSTSYWGSTYRFWGFDNDEYILSTDKPVTQVTSAVTNVVSAANDYKDTMDAMVAAYSSFEDVYNFQRLYPNSFNTALSNMQSTYIALTTALGDGDSDTSDEAALIASMFEDYAAYQDVLSNFETVADLDTYLEVAEEMETFSSESADYGTFSSLGFDDGVDLIADYEEYRAMYNTLSSSTDGAFEYLCKLYDIDETYYTNFSDNVDAYTAIAIKAELDDLVATYGDYTADDVANLDATTQSVVYTTLDTSLTTVTSYSTQVVYASNIFDGDFEEYYLLKSLFFCEVNPAIAYFVEMGLADLDDYDTDYLIDCLNDFDIDYAQLDAAYAVIVAETTQANAATVLRTVYSYADALVERIYACLANRFTAQVDYAYLVYNSIDGGVTASTMDVVLYYELKSSIGAIDADIITALDSNYTSLVSSDTRTDYSSLSSIISIYTTYAATLGFDSFETYEMDYTDREVYETDVVNDTTYAVDAIDMSTIIELLDKILADEDIITMIANLLGLGEEGEEDVTFTLSSIVEDLIADMLFSDSIINMIVGLIYPIVEGEFNGIDLPTSYSIFSISYTKTLASIVADSGSGEGGLCIDPQSLAWILDDTLAPTYSGDNYSTINYKSFCQEGIEALNAAGTNWYSAEIYDGLTGTWTINWGMDDYKEANPDAEFEDLADQFISSAGAALQGLYPLLGALLLGQSWYSNRESIATVSSTLTVDLTLEASANNGYVNFLGPIFEVLGYYKYSTTSDCSKISNATEFIQMAYDDIYATVSNLLESPVENILSALPGVVYSLLFDMIPSLMSMLSTTIAYDASVSGISAYSDDIDIDLGEMLNLADMGLDTSNGLNGILGLLGLELTGFNEGIVATLGTKTTTTSNRTASIYGLSSGKAYSIEGDADAVLYYVLTYVIDSIKNGSLYTLLGAFLDDSAIATVEEIVGYTGIADVSVTSGDIIAAVVQLLDTTSYEDLISAETLANYEYFSMPEVSETAIEYYTDPDTDKVLEIPYGYTVGDDGYLIPIEDGLYSDYWTTDTASYIIEDLPNFAVQAASLFGYDIDEYINGTLDDLLETYITQDMLASIFDMIDPYLSMLTDDETISMIVDIVVDLGIVDDIEVKEIITHLSTFDYTTYEFEDGDIEGMLEVIIDFVAPLSPIFEFILLDGTISVYNETIVVEGGNGYETALVPIYEAFGITADEMSSYDDLVALAAVKDGEEAFIEAVISPIVTFITDLLTTVQSEDGTLTVLYNVLDLLPNVLYFIEQGGLNTALENILLPVYVVLDKIRPIYSLSFTLDFDLVDVVDGLLSSIAIDEEIFVIPSFNELILSIKQISASEERTSVTGETYNYLSLTNDGYADLVSMLLVEAIEGATILENVQPYINIVVAMSTFLPDSLASEELTELLNGFAELNETDQVLFVVYYLVYGVDVAEETITGFYDLIDDSLEAFFEVIGGFTSEQYIEIAEETSNLASDLKDQLDEWGADPEQTEVVLTWFEEIIQAIQDFFAMIAEWFTF
ncbi:MAG: hypothetical protein R3Y27_03230 [Clostridia bacterium]